MMKLLLILVLMFQFAYADFESDLEQISNFKTSEFENPKNYKDETVANGILSDEFVTRILGDEKQLRYFYVSYLHYHFDKKYKKDKVFTLSVDKKFDKKNLTPEQEISFKRSLASLVFTDKLENLKDALPENDREADDYFFKTMNKLDGARLK